MDTTVSTCKSILTDAVVHLSVRHKTVATVLTGKGGARISATLPDIQPPYQVRGLGGVRQVVVVRRHSAPSSKRVDTPRQAYL